MIKVKIENFEATFDNLKWTCDDANLQKVLNMYFDIDEIGPGAAYITYKKAIGLDAVALRAIGFLSPKLIENNQKEIPEEVKGTVI